MIRKLAWLFALLVLLLAISAAALHFWVKQQMEQPIALEQAQLFEIPAGYYRNAVLEKLAAEGLLTNPQSLKIALKLYPDFAPLKAGIYEITPGQSWRDVFNGFASGKVKTISLTLIEGQRWQDWLAQIQASSYLQQDITPEALQKLVLPYALPEGLLMPDTYQIDAGSSALQLITRAHGALQAFLLQQWPQRHPDLPYTSPYEALIMASIIEKETGVAEERPRIAAVFVNRLRKKMRLQTDPTVIYGMGDRFDGDIRRRDLREATPYNTYVIRGLPPTPIAMVSKAAIVAALRPISSNELYFVAKGDGSHVFSETLAEHNAAVRQYQLKGN